MTAGGWIQWLKIRKDAVKMVEATALTWGRYHQAKAKKCNRGVERGLRGAKGNVWRREYHFRSDHRGIGTTPHLHCDFVPLDCWGIYRRKTG